MSLQEDGLLPLAVADTLSRLASAYAGEAYAAALAAAKAVDLGHTCADLEGAATEAGVEIAVFRRNLLDSGIATEASSGLVRPVIVDSAGRLYLRRYYIYEKRLAAAILHRTGKTPEQIPVNLPLYAACGPEQKLAVLLARSQPFLAVSGGPGTGKTATVAAMLAACLNDAPNLSVALAAPTGKAAARMMESLSRRMDELPAAARERLPESAMTLHRLLGNQGEGRFRHHAANPLPMDLIVVDEASMIDLAMACRLFDALRPGARVILLGDKDQLAAVDAGAVFAELGGENGLSPVTAKAVEGILGTCPAPTGSHPLADRVVWLETSYRFGADSGIAGLAKLVREGEADAALAWLSSPLPEDIAYASPAEDDLTRLARGYGAYMETVAAGAGADSAFIALQGYRLLCALRSGPQGVETINEVCCETLRRQLPGTLNPHGKWFAGLPIMVTENDYGRQLFNGDIGIVLPQGRQLLAHFPGRPGEWRQFSQARLPPWEPAFAMTVHKAQGSEFDHACLLLPQRDTAVVSRELIYTAITRAARRFSLVAAPAILAAGIRRSSRRRSGLADRLREIMAEESEP